MNARALFERDILYPTGSINEPGSIHISVLSPNREAKIPVIVESKSDHSPYEYLDSIVRIIQSDIFDRVFVDIKKNVILYFKVSEKDIARNNGKEFIKVVYNGSVFESSGADSVE